MYTFLYYKPQRARLTSILRLSYFKINYNQKIFCAQTCDCKQDRTAKKKKRDLIMYAWRAVDVVVGYKK